MSPTRTNSLRRTAVRLTAGACVVLLLQACSGGSCSRKPTAGPDSGTVTPGETIADNDAMLILNRPVEFDPRALAEINSRLDGENIPTPAQTAEAIVNAEAASDHLCHLLEELVKNDDMADTWNIFAELKQSRWPSHLVGIIDKLDVMPLDSEQRLHLSDLEKAMQRNRVLIAELRARNNRLPLLLDED